MVQESRPTTAVQRLHADTASHAAGKTVFVPCVPWGMDCLCVCSSVWVCSVDSVGVRWWAVGAFVVFTGGTVAESWMNWCLLLLPNWLVTCMRVKTLPPAYAADQVPFSDGTAEQSGHTIPRFANRAEKECHENRWNRSIVKY